MVAEQLIKVLVSLFCCSLAKISMVAELKKDVKSINHRCSLAKISMVAELQHSP